MKSMLKIHHLNCVQIVSPPGSAIGHCMLLEEDNQLILVDAGIGLEETRDPKSKLGKELIEITGFKFDEEIRAIKEIEKLGFPPDQLGNRICSHLDPDHIGGLAYFPSMTVHVAKEEYDSFQSGDERYLRRQRGHAIYDERQ